MFPLPPQVSYTDVTSPLIFSRTVPSLEPEGADRRNYTIGTNAPFPFSILSLFENVAFVAFPFSITASAGGYRRAGLNDIFDGPNSSFGFTYTP